MVIEWLKGNDPNLIGHADGCTTGWMVRAQYALERCDSNDAQTYISASEEWRLIHPGEILSQLINEDWSGRYSET